MPPGQLADLEHACDGELLQDMELGSREVETTDRGIES